MTAGCRTHLLHLSSSRSFGALEFFFTECYPLTHACLSNHLDRQRVNTSLIRVWAAKGYLLLLINDRAGVVAYCALAFHMQDSPWQRKWEEEGDKRARCAFLLKEGFRGPAELTIQYFQRGPTAGIRPVYYCLRLWLAFLQVIHMGVLKHCTHIF